MYLVQIIYFFEVRFNNVSSYQWIRRLVALILIYEWNSIFAVDHLWSSHRLEATGLVDRQPDVKINITTSRKPVSHCRHSWILRRDSHRSGAEKMVWEMTLYVCKCIGINIDTNLRGRIHWSNGDVTIYIKFDVSLRKRIILQKLRIIGECSLPASSWYSPLALLGSKKK